MGQFSLLEYTQFRLLASSRVMGCEINGKDSDLMIPFADMANHKAVDPEVTWIYD